MNKKDIKVGMMVLCNDVEYTVVEIFSLPGGKILVEIGRAQETLRVSPTALSRVKAGT